MEHDAVMEPAGERAEERAGERAERAPARRPRRESRWAGALLWTVAVVAMLSAAVYQRRTGPTYPLRGEAVVGAVTFDYHLVRSGTSTDDAVVEIPDPGGDVTAWLVYRRYPTDDPYARVPFRPAASPGAPAAATVPEPEDGAGAGGALHAPLPRQPAAGKLEYHLLLEGPTERVRVPASPEGDPIIRFKDPVPLAALIPHVLFMFFAILVGVRAGLAAVVGRRDARRYAWVALGLMSVGGMILGPIVQKFAFGAFWTGFPFGYDLTDNKTLVMWLVWVGACAVLGLRARDRSTARAGRVAIVLATAVMLVVYLVPHSLRGSQLDYDQLDDGADAAEAIRTG